MNKYYFINLLILLTYFSTTQCQLSCLTDAGLPVEWAISYVFPMDADTNPDANYIDNFGYTYSVSSEIIFEISSVPIDD